MVLVELLGAVVAELCVSEGFHSQMPTPFSIAERELFLVQGFNTRMEELLKEKSAKTPADVHLLNTITKLSPII
jgi:hypothetical protein